VVETRDLFSFLGRCTVCVVALIVESSSAMPLSLQRNAMLPRVGRSCVHACKRGKDGGGGRAVQKYDTSTEHGSRQLSSSSSRRRSSGSQIVIIAAASMPRSEDLGCRARRSHTKKTQHQKKKKKKKKKKKNSKKNSGGANPMNQTDRDWWNAGR
jgi:hypothetical protein